MAAKMGVPVGRSVKAGPWDLPVTTWGTREQRQQDDADLTRSWEPGVASTVFVEGEVALLKIEQHSDLIAHAVRLAIGRAHTAPDEHSTHARLMSVNDSARTSERSEVKYRLR
jgi:hypothetical protein